MKNILVLTDFSAAARNAEEYAVCLAQKLGAQVQLLHMYQEIIPATASLEPWSMNITDGFAENEKLINKEVDYLNDKYATKVSGKVEPGTKTNLLKTASKDTDLIVLGAKHKKQNKLLGSTVEKAIRTSQVPLLIIPEEAAFTEIKNGTVAVDFTAMLQDKYFNVLRAIYNKFNTALRILHIQPKGAETKAIELPEKLQLGIVLSGFTYEYDLIEADEVDKSIVNYINSHPTDLLMLIAHHHNVFERVFGKEHSISLLHKIKVPLLLVAQ